MKTITAHRILLRHAPLGSVHSLFYLIDFFPSKMMIEATTYYMYGTLMHPVHALKCRFDLVLNRDYLEPSE